MHSHYEDLINGYVEGLGSADMKGFVASLIANIDNFKQIKRLRINSKILCSIQHIIRWRSIAYAIKMIGIMPQIRIAR